MKEVLKKYAKRYFIDAMGAMALGLFASLLIGTIFNTIGMIPGLSVMSTIGKGAQAVAGAAMAIAIAVSLKADPLVVYTCAAARISSFLQATESLFPSLREQRMVKRL